jgi:pyridoxamine 5'-phosphate oxidase
MPEHQETDLAHLRREYANSPLDPTTLADDPLTELRSWLDAAAAGGVTEPNAMTLATVDARQRPTARVVLLRGLDRGLVFFTNYASRKGTDLAHNPHAAVVLCWLELARQVRVTGTCERVSDAESDRYWRTRPPESRLVSAASPQSRVLADGAELALRIDDLRQRHPDGHVPRPAHWGGFRLVPDAVEFWVGRPDRRHDRISFRRGDGGWSTERLAP